MMLYREIKEQIREDLEEVTSKKISPSEIEESVAGDFSFKTFRLVKGSGKTPGQLAEEIARDLQPGDYIEKVETVGPYLNFFIDYSRVLDSLATAITTTYGKFPDKGKKIILEHTSVNPSGPIHVGRMRNSLIGDSLARILKFYGYQVETHFYVNDIGKQIAIIAQGYEEGLAPDEEVIQRYERYKDKSDFQTFFQYVTANRRFQNDEDFQQLVQARIKKAEAGDNEILEEISSVGRSCLNGQKETFNRLGIYFDFFDFESKYIKNGAVSEVLASLRKSRYAKEIAGGFGLDLENFGLKKKGGVSVLTRADGTSVYLSRDIAYHLEKARLGDEMITILGEDHKFEFREVKTILGEILGIDTPLEVVHFSFVSFEDGGLSTRKGHIAPVDQLIDKAVKKASQEIEKRGIAEKEIAPLIGIGAIKYRLLKTSPEKPITFRWQEALDFEGDSCPYIQYSYARCCSILRNSEKKGGKGAMDNSGLEQQEKDLLREIIKFPQVVEMAAQEKKPHLIANYLYQISSHFSRFYKKCQVLDVEAGTEKRRLLLVKATRTVIKNGLQLLGIGAPERM